MGTRTPGLLPATAGTTSQQSIPAGQRPGTCSPILRRPGRLLYFPAVLTCACITEVRASLAGLDARLDIPRRYVSSGAGELVLGAVGPGGGLAVGGAGREAAVEDADEAVAEGAEGLVAGVAGRAVLVVAGAGAGAGGEGGEGPEIDRVGEVLAADVAGQDGPFRARSPGDW
jgi:hypothetical protein